MIRTTFATSAKAAATPLWALGVLSVVSLLSGCAAVDAVQNFDRFPIVYVPTAYDAATQTRVRVLNGAAIPNSTCYKNPVSTGDALGKVMKAMVTMRVDSTSVGMPRKGKYEHFVEGVYPAGSPVTVASSYSNYDNLRNNSSCRPGAMYFHPEKGVDYEVQVDVDYGSRTCRLGIRVLDVDGRPGDKVQAYPAPECPSQ